MRSRWGELLRLLLAALLEAIWLGALAALLAGAPPAPLVFASWPLVAAGGALADAARRRQVRPGERAWAAPYQGLLLAVAVLAVAGFTLTAGHNGLEPLVVALLSSGCLIVVALWLGVRAGRAEIDASRAFSRALRCFALVFLVVGISYAAGQPLAGSDVLVALAVLGGLALVAVARVLVTLTSIESARPRAVWRWTAGVLAAGLLALALAALVATLPAGGAFAWLGGVALAALQAVATAVGYLIAVAGYAVMRALAGLIRLFHLDVHVPEQQPPEMKPLTPVTPQSRGEVNPLLAQIFGVVASVALAALAVRLLLRSFRLERRAPSDEALEEHEALARTGEEMRSAGRRAWGALGGFVRRAVGLRTPVETLRADYRQLESALRRLGHRREPSWSARRYLLSLPVVPSPAAPGPGSREAADLDGGEKALSEGAVPTPSRVRLAELYERARYSAERVEWEDVAEFKAARRSLLTDLSG